MTCIAGIAHKGSVWIGGDSMASLDWGQRRTRLKKVFRVGEFLIGYTSSFRMAQILQYHVRPEPRQKGVGVREYMVTEFIESVRTAFKDFGFTTIKESNEAGGFFLVGYAGRLFQVDPDFQVNEYRDGMAAVGAGADYALGAMITLKGLSPLERIERALLAAEELSAAVAGPFTIRKI